MHVTSPSSPPSRIVAPHTLPANPPSDHVVLSSTPRRSPSWLKRPLSIVFAAHRALDAQTTPATLASHHPGPTAEAPPKPTSSPLHASCDTPTSDTTTAMTGPHLVVFSGGTAWNSVAGSLRRYTTRVSHVLPVSDDGGSTAEIVRVVGGPAVGDIRSRCLRLADDSNQEARAVRRLLAHRLPTGDEGAAQAEWYRIVEGQHPLWEGVSDPYKHTIRAFLVHFHTEILRHSSERFNFSNGSVGNFFFAGARIFFRSLEAAIFLFSRVARLPEGSRVLPSIATEERITLGAQLADGSVIRGQNEISHPSVAESPCSNVVDKLSQTVPLEAPIRRIFYLSHEGTHHEHEVTPPTNTQVLADVSAADAVVYAMGSLYTSIGPNLILRGVGEAVAASSAAKILILNGTHDRETGCCVRTGGPMAASGAMLLSVWMWTPLPGAPRVFSETDVVEAVCGMLNRSHTRSALQHPPGAYVHTVLVPSGGDIEVDAARLAELGVRDVVEVPSVWRDGQCLYDPDMLVSSIADVLAASA